jgi:hypothetical protein
LVRDIENSYFELETPDDSVLHELLGHSISYRIAVGRHAGRKAFTLQTNPAQEQQSTDNQLAKANGFSLYAGVSATDHQRRKLEQLCHYIARPEKELETMLSDTFRVTVNLIRCAHGFACRVRRPRPRCTN